MTSTLSTTTSIVNVSVSTLVHFNIQWANFNYHLGIRVDIDKTWDAAAWHSWWMRTICRLLIGQYSSSGSSYWLTLRSWQHDEGGSGSSRPSSVSKLYFYKTLFIIISSRRIQNMLWHRLVIMVRGFVGAGVLMWWDLDPNIFPINMYWPDGFKEASEC